MIVINRFVLSTQLAFYSSNSICLFSVWFPLCSQSTFPQTHYTLIGRQIASIRNVFGYLNARCFLIAGSAPLAAGWRWLAFYLVVGAIVGAGVGLDSHGIRIRPATTKRNKLHKHDESHVEPALASWPSVFSCGASFCVPHNVLP